MARGGNTGSTFTDILEMSVFDAAQETLPKIDLSQTEQAQLGSVRLLKNGKEAAHPYPAPEQWTAIRSLLVERSVKSNPLLDGRLTAYTPGETLELLQQPEIKSWHEKMQGEMIDPKYTTIVLVPCAKTKPWTGDAIKKSKLYSAYNAIRTERDDICFVTISEPLGVVPMQHWADFPQYDNPGLFRDDAQQSGMTRVQWENTEFGKWYGLPFDEEAWDTCIEKLGGLVGEFLSRHQDRKIVSFVDEGKGPISTHGAMLNVAQKKHGIKVERHAKRGQARISPLPYLREKLS